MDLSLSKCSMDHLDLLLEISKSTFRDAFEHLNNPKDFQAYLASAFDKEKIESELNGIAVAYYLVYKEGLTAGYFKLNRAPAQTDLTDPDSFEIERLYVRKEYQGMKIGNWMIAQIILLAQQAGMTYLWLGVWEKNQDAIRFYERMGFKKFKEHAFYIGKDKQTDWLMRLVIPKL